jgi:flavin reductase (DIM6/NTAB) family NADH-FMN oxidoreductase RutF
MATSLYNVTVILTAGKVLNLTLDEHDLRHLRSAVANPVPTVPTVTVDSGNRQITILATSVAAVSSTPASC